MTQDYKDSPFNHIMNWVNIFAKYMINLGKAVDNSANAMILDYTAKKHPKISLEKPIMPRRSIIYNIDKHPLLKTKNPVLKQLFSIYSTDLVKQEVANLNPSTVSYNQSCVMFVSALEVLLQDIFTLIVNNDKNVQKKLLESGLKVDLILLQDYKDGKITLADIVIMAKKYNFQNLYSARDALMTVSNKDLLKILNKTLPNKEMKRLIDLINLRHRIVHESHYNEKIGWDDITSYHAFLWHIGFVTLLAFFIKNDITQAVKNRKRHSK